MKNMRKRVADSEDLTKSQAHAQGARLLVAPAITYLPAHTRYRSSNIPHLTGSPQSANGAMGRVRPDGQQRSDCTSHSREVTSSSAK
jgi:hypothetical protein